MTRLFEFKNSYIGEPNCSVNAEYNVFGYFDGLTMKTFEDNENFPLAYRSLVSKRLDEKCDYFDIIGLRKDENKDKIFWEEKNEPYIFISFVRLKKPSSDIRKLIEEFEKQFDGIGYTSVDHSDFLFCIRRKRFKDGYQCLKEYFEIVINEDDANCIEKIFTSVAISQTLLDIMVSTGEERWSEEKREKAGSEFVCLDKKERIFCSLRGVIKDNEKVKEFQAELGKQLNTGIKAFDIVGSEDVILIPDDGIFSETFLKLYVSNGLLTHDNPLYSSAFYNIRTDVLCHSQPRKEGAYE